MRYYQRGVYTRLEALTLLVQAAAEHQPSELAQGLPAEWLQAIREDTISPPGSPSDVLYISGIRGDPNFDYETHLDLVRWSMELAQILCLTLLRKLPKRELRDH